MSILGTRSKILNHTFKVWSNFRVKRVSHDCNNLSYTNRNSFIYLRKSERYTSSMVASEACFRFIDYDCIGFDLDNTLSRYKVGAMIEMEYKVMSKFLVEKKGYSEKHLLQPFDHNFILRGLIVDDENGNVLRIASDGYILQASHGTRMLQDEEIEKYYPKRHWQISDIFVQDPLTTWNGPYSQKIRTLLDFFDIAASLLFARVVDSLDEDGNNEGKKYSIWPHIQEALQDMFDRDNFQSGSGGYFKEMKANPEKYYYKSSEQVLKWLKSLKEQKKMLFLLTGSHVDFASHTASNTLGPNWRDYFDIVVCFAKKPGFFTMNRDFMKLDGVKEGSAVHVNDLRTGGIYTQGNWIDLQKFLTKNLDKTDPKFLYIGDNLIQDIYTPHIYSKCDTVTICEELEAEGANGYQQWHPDQQFLMSTVWGSYFHCNNIPTNWHYLMKKHSKFSVPSLEYVASLPINHEFKSNDQ